MNKSESKKLWYDRYLPEATKGDWSIRHYSLTQSAANLTTLRALLNNRPGDEVEAGDYMMLASKTVGIMMSNTQHEFESNYDFITAATGKVFIAGLGLGLVPRLLLEHGAVSSITIVELEQDVIDLVSPHLHHHGEVDIIKADALTYKATCKYDSVWFDIWPTICGDNLAQMKKLRRRWLKWWTQAGPLGSWSQDELQQRHTQTHPRVNKQSDNRLLAQLRRELRNNRRT